MGGPLAVWSPTGFVLGSRTTAVDLASNACGSQSVSSWTETPHSDTLTGPPTENANVPGVPHLGLHAHETWSLTFCWASMSGGDWVLENLRCLGEGVLGSDQSLAEAFPSGLGGEDPGPHLSCPSSSPRGSTQLLPTDLLGLL